MVFEVNKTASSGCCSMLFGAGQRVHFGAFNAKNDVNSKTKRSGVRLYTNKVAIWILSKLGKTEKIKVGDKEYIVNKKSFQSWKTRHLAIGKVYKGLDAATVIAKVLDYRAKGISNHLAPLTAPAKKLQPFSAKFSDAEFHPAKKLPRSLKSAKAAWKRAVVTSILVVY